MQKSDRYSKTLISKFDEDKFTLSNQCHVIIKFGQIYVNIHTHSEIPTRMKTLLKQKYLQLN